MREMECRYCTFIFPEGATNAAASPSVDSRHIAPRCPVCSRGRRTGFELRDGMVAPVNRLNVGNPNYTPSKVPAKEESAASDRTTTLPRPLAIMPSKAHLLIRRLVV